MKITEATEFIRPAQIQHAKQSMWADLGCGEGVFTFALAELLAPGSTIFAIDKLRSIPDISERGKVEIRFQQSDFEKNFPVLPMLDGIIMANSLHYIANQPGMMSVLKTKLKREGVLLIVEYDTSTENRWVPYPVRYDELKKLLSHVGFLEVRKIGERPSVYNQNMMYAALASGFESQPG